MSSAPRALGVSRLVRFSLTPLALLLGLYACVCLLMNSRFTSPIVDLVVGWRFSGELSWARTSWGPEPWDVRVLAPKIVDASGATLLDAASLEVDDFWYLGLLSDHIGARATTLRDAHVKLKERAHLFKPHSLEWDIAEVFQPPHPTLDDGQVLPPMTLDFGGLNITRADVEVEMSVTRLLIKDVRVRNGHFGFDLSRKAMMMRADEVTAGEAHTQVWVRNTNALPPRERAFLAHTAPVELALTYPLHSLNIEGFFWVGDRFGASLIKARLYERDVVTARDAMLNLISGGTPELSGALELSVASLEPYVSPWGLQETLRGEVSGGGQLYGPVSDPCAHSLNLTGQLFLPTLNDTRFTLKASKGREGDVSLKGLRVWSALGDFALRGELSLPFMRGDLQLDINTLTWRDLAPLPLEWRPWGAAAQGGARLKLRPHSEHTFELSAELSSALQGPAPLWVEARAALTGERLAVPYATVLLGERDAPQLSLSTRADIDLKGERLQGSLEASASLHPKLLPPLTLPVQGRAQLSVKANGPWRAPLLTGQLKGKGLRGALEGFHWSLADLSLPFSLSPQTLTLRPFHLKGSPLTLTGELSVPLARPELVEGWVNLQRVELDLTPLKLPVSGRFKGLACTSVSGCARYFKRYPEQPKRSPDSCISALEARVKGEVDAQQAPSSERQSKRQSKRHSVRGAERPLELCLTGDRVRYEHFTLDELMLGGRWESLTRRLTLRRGRAWRGRQLLIDTEAQLDLKLDELDASLKLYSVPLQLGRLFLTDPPPELKGLFGVLDGELELSGSLKAPTGSGSLKASHVSLPLSALDLPNPLSIALTELSFELTTEGLSAQGHIDKALWWRGVVPFGAEAKRSPAQLTLELFDLNLSLLSAPTPGSREGRAVLKRLRDEGLGHEGLSLTPLVLKDKQLVALGVGRASYCALSALELPEASLSHVALQGRVDASLMLSDPTRPTVRAHLEGLHLEQWLRDSLGKLRASAKVRSAPQVNRKGAREQTLGEVRAGAQASKTDLTRCDREGQTPTLSLSNARPAHIEVHSLKAPADHIYLNPEPVSVKRPSSTLISTPSVVRGWRSGERVRLEPLTLEGADQRLSLSVGLIQEQLTADLQLRVGVNALSPFLQELFQQFEGELVGELSARGAVAAPAISGSVEVRDLALLSPRVQLIGDLRQLTPLSLSLTPLKEGGVSVALAQREGVTLMRNEAELKLSSLNLSLPQLSFERLSVGFSAPQLEANLPKLARVSAQLRDMRFMMEQVPQQPFELSLSGEVDLLRLLYTGDIISTDEINRGVRNNFTGRSAVETMSVFERVPLLKRLKLDLHVQGEEDLIVRNQVGGVLKLDLDVMVDLNMRGYLYTLPTDPLDAQLTLSGEVSTLDGSSITYANNSFDVLDGRVLFGGALKGTSQASNFMSADIEATHTFRIPRQSTSSQQVSFDRTLSSDLVDEEVTLRAQLLLPTKESRPQIELDLSSQSGASKIEVATLVITGRYPNNLNAAASTQPATEVLLAPILNLIERPIEDSLGINLSLTPDTSGAGLFIDLNKSFSRRTRLYARTPIGEDDTDSSRSFGLEYKLNNALSGELTREQVSKANATSGRLRLRLSWE